MSFTTRCPACGTTFKIVPDQLKISDGWVRCGHCADVFDATLFLEGESAPVSPVIPAEPALAEALAVDGEPGMGAVSELPKVVVPVPDPQPVSASEEEDKDGDWLLHPVSSVPVQDPVVPHTAPDPVPDPGPAPASKPASVDDAFVDELRRFAQSSSVGVPETDAPEVPPVAPYAAGAPSVVSSANGAARAAAAAPEGYDLPVAPDVLPEAPSDEPLLPVEPGFVRQARRRAFWRSRGMRAAMVVVSLLLGLGLLAQVAVHERDSLAARFPATTPLLTALCLPTGCEIGPVRQIESVVIDSSNLVRRLGNFYSFDFVLKNSARTPVAVPALELSLTDTREAVIVRRVFLPDEMPGAPQLLPAQGSLSLSLRLSIADQGVSSMSGYRALVFYP